MRKFFSLVGIFVLFGCTSIADLKKPSTPQYFVLKEDYVRVQTRGLAKVKWLEGLKSGKYSAVAEDKDGIYFQGEGASVILLNNQVADDFQRTGKIPESVLAENRIPRALSVGGIFLPKAGSKKGMMLFYNLQNANSGASLGLLPMAITSATEGSLQYVAYDSEKGLLEKIAVVNY